jgi:hydantoinase/carbamoylase family amidase
MTTTALRHTRIDADRLTGRLDRLRAVGATPAGGVDRPAFSPSDVRGRTLVASLMREAGLAVRVDPAANLIGTRPGRDPGLGALVLGSHLDTVPDGGAYDGAYGVLAAVEVAASLADAGVELDRPLTVVAFSNEEGTTGTPAMFGSRAIAGQVEKDELDQVAAGGERTLGELLDSAGGDSSRIGEARWDPGSAAAYLELHIEQGPVLQHAGEDIGVVEGICGRLTAEVVVVGEANHAGTTPMSARRDALLAAAHIVLAVPRLGGAPAAGAAVRVATVGDCSVQPGAWNVVPGQSRLVVDLRDIRESALDTALARLRQEAAEVAESTGTRVTVTELQRVRPTPCDPRARQTVEQVARGLGLSRRSLASGAGHDAQWMARIAPMGMIFVPSHAGVSHVPHEWTAPADLVNGAEVLLGCTLVEGMHR